MHEINNNIIFLRIFAVKKERENEILINHRYNLSFLMLLNQNKSIYIPQISELQYNYTESGGRIE